MNHISTKALLTLTIILTHSFDTNGMDAQSYDHAQTPPLHHAVENNDHSLIESLIQNKADIEIVDFNGNTPLAIAATKSSLATIQQLINYGANINPGCKWGDPLLNALFRAGNTTNENEPAQTMNTEIIQTLIQAKADLSYTEFLTCTPLHYIASFATPLLYTDLIMERLIENNADINAYDSEFKTPLEVAYAAENNSAIEFLKEHGAH